MGFLSFQPGLDGLFREEPPAAYDNALGQIVSPGQLVADGPRLQAERVGELLDRVQRLHDRISDSGLGPQSLPR